MIFDAQNEPLFTHFLFSPFNREAKIVNRIEKAVTKIVVDGKGDQCNLDVTNDEIVLWCDVKLL